MGGRGLVSVIVPFLNAARFIEETVDSVKAQSYRDWELLLVDDGSSDASTEIARDLSDADEQVTYLQHPGHANRGISATRNLGIQHARGEFIAFLDADDLWLTEKLERQVGILREHPEAAMVYGVSKYWYSWSSDNVVVGEDFEMPQGIPSDRLISPPDLLKDLVSNRAIEPIPCSTLNRTHHVLEVKGFEDSFPGLYDDQVFFAKICLNYPVFVSSACSDLYRQHANSICATTTNTPQEVALRSKYLQWLASYLRQREVTDPELWRLLARQIWLLGNPESAGISMRNWDRRRWIRKQVLRLEQHLVPTPLQSKIWAERVQGLGAPKPDKSSEPMH